VREIHERWVGAVALCSAPRYTTPGTVGHVDREAQSTITRRPSDEQVLRMNEIEREIVAGAARYGTQLSPDQLQELVEDHQRRRRETEALERRLAREERTETAMIVIGLLGCLLLAYCHA
jgi:hypothetical protein